jgi:hypothetical protein
MQTQQNLTLAFVTFRQGKSCKRLDVMKLVPDDFPVATHATLCFNTGSSPLPLLVPTIIPCCLLLHDPPQHSVPRVKSPFVVRHVRATRPESHFVRISRVRLTVV